MTTKINRKTYIVSMMGTALEYYDMSLYGFMAPILIAIFLPTIDPLNALIITFLMYPIGLISRPIGAILIGKIGDNLGRKKALTIAIFGMAISTGIIGLLPTYHQIGIAAPILFTLCRAMQSFFVAGEYNGGAIYILEHTHDKNKGYVSGLYCAYTVSGIISAAAIATLVTYLPEGYWRLPYLLGFVTGAFGFYVRMNALESPEFLQSKPEPKSKISIEIIRKYVKEMICVIGVTGFFGALYTMPALLMTSFVPLITDLSTRSVMMINTLSLVIYMFLLPVSGMIADRIGLIKSMMIATIATILVTIPLIKLLSFGTIETVFMAKAGFAILSAWYVGPFHAMLQSLFKVNHRYSLISLSYSIGSQIGGAMPGIGLWIWKKTNKIESISAIIIIWAIVGGLCCVFAKKKRLGE